MRQLLAVATLATSAMLAACDQPTTVEPTAASGPSLAVAPPAPPRPINSASSVTATARQTTVTVRWSLTVTGHEREISLWRRADGGGAQQIFRTSTARSADSYTDGATKAGSSYSYLVRVTSADGTTYKDSPWSPTVSTIPAAVINGASYDNRRATLTLTYETKGATTAALEYSGRAAGRRGLWPNQRSITINPFSPGTYTFSMEACNDAGCVRARSYSYVAR
jgi:hypothetical protein